ncbi:hypothetical protein D0962_28340 [Leptolyngbyaceae cyanobacterium CCMR0082]|uniref:Uncharacterized protein n=1 Tax=Adonisia turfae CCMR0082 TaxID=2304604 RepID=A0A6M0SG73_9CYAN|nr:hypothetical protein [Adonisia turfae CCMR0082]
MFLDLATECGLSRAIADEIWCGARVDLLQLKHHSREKLKVKNNGNQRAEIEKHLSSDLGKSRG